MSCLLATSLLKVSSESTKKRKEPPKPEPVPKEVQEWYILFEYFGWDFDTVYYKTPQKVLDWTYRLLAEKGKDQNSKGHLLFRGLREYEFYRSLMRSKGMID